MRRAAAAVVGLVAIAAGAANADADGFGGFSADGARYLVGTELVCEPLAVKPGASERRAPACMRADAKAVAAGKFRRARSKLYRARASGKQLVVERAGGGDPVVTWSADGIIKRVVGVYEPEEPVAGRALIAVELEVESLGRARLDAVAFALHDAATGPATTTTDDKAAAAAARKRGDAAARKRAWADAEKAYREALRLDPADDEARYRLATVHAHRKARGAMLAELRALASTERADARAWLLAARTDKAFARYRKDPEFRAVVGLDGGGAGRTAFERLMDPGGRWTQPRVPCEQAGVELTLRARPRTFALTIEVRCQSDEFGLDLDGRWDSEGEGRLVLVFPNEGGEEERVQCEISACGDEDCVHCDLGDGLAFTLRPRR